MQITKQEKSLHIGKFLLIQFSHVFILELSETKYFFVLFRALMMADKDSILNTSSSITVYQVRNVFSQI